MTFASMAALMRFENQRVLVSGRNVSGRGAKSRPAKWTMTSAPSTVSGSVAGFARSAFTGRTFAASTKIGRQRRPVVHQTKLVPARQQMAREQTAEIAGCAGNEDNHAISSGLSRSYRIGTRSPVFQACALRPTCSGFALRAPGLCGLDTDSTRPTLCAC